MKKTFNLLLIALTAVILQSCGGKEGCTDPEATNYDATAEEHDGTCIYDSGKTFTVINVAIDGVTYKQLQGSINEDFTMTASYPWLLSGGVFVEENAVLTIESGVTVYAADDGTTPFLSILQGAQIMAEGTAASPIVFTSIKSSPAAGDWGGIVVNGYANINTGATATGEGGTGVYGGSDDADNSGTIKFVRVEYAGKILGTDNELNGFSFNGVGSGTTIEYIQAFKGADDGIEFFGGTVNVRYAVSTGNQDDSFDWTHGWKGNGQFWVVEQSNEGGDRGIEADNNSNDNSISPSSFPTLSNVTLVGTDDGDGSNQAIKLREGTKAKIYNLMIQGFPKRGIQVEHDVTLSNLEAGELLVRSAIVDNVNPFVYTSSDGSSFTPTTPFESEATNSTSSVTLQGVVGTASANASNPTSLGSWFSSALYIGAVPASANWMSGWTNTL